MLINLHQHHLLISRKDSLYCEYISWCIAPGIERRVIKQTHFQVTVSPIYVCTFLLFFGCEAREDGKQL